jgi:hypothetical protein
VAEDPGLLAPGQCPVCRRKGMLLMSTGNLYCSAEDEHPGGLILMPDGETKTFGVAPRATVVASPIEGGPKA